MSSAVEPTKPDSSPTVQKMKSSPARDVVQLRLCALEEALTGEPTRSDSDLRLVYIVALPLEVALDAEGDLDTYLLVGLEDIVEDVVHRVEEAERSDGKDGHQEVAQEVFAQGEVEECAYGDDDEGYSHIGEVEGDEEVHHSCDEIHAEDSTYGVEEVAPAVAPVLGIDGVEGGGEEGG